MARQLDPHYAKYLTKIPGFLDKQIDPVVERLLEAVPDFQSFLDVIKYLDELCAGDPRCTRLDSTEYKFCDYYFLTGLRFVLSRNFFGMVSANRKDIRFAPEVIDVHDIGEGSVLHVTRIEGTDAGNVVPFREVRDRVPIAQREAALREIESLLLYYNYFYKSSLDWRSWFVVPSTGRLILLDFRDAVRAPENRHPEVLREAREVLGLPII